MPKTETEIAIGQIKDEELKECQGIGPDKGNNVGNLLLDYADLAASASDCITRHNSLVRYLAPIVTKEKSK